MDHVTLKHKRTTLERAEKFISVHHFTDINLRSKLYTKKAPVISITHYPAPGRITVHEALKAEYVPVAVGQTFGPTWSTHWFCVSVEVPPDWEGEEVHLLWNSDSEALVWIDGNPVQGLSGNHDRNSYSLCNGPIQDKLRYEIYIEMVCNGLLGAGLNGMINPPDPDRHFTLSQAEIGIYNRDIYNLIIDVEMLHDIAKYMSEDTERGYQALYAVNQLINTIDIDDPSTYSRAHNIAEKFFHQKNGASCHTLHAMGHAHIDTAWLWPYAETIRKCARSWSCTLRLMEQYPNFTFTCSQAQQLEWVKEHYSSLYKQIQHYHKRGQFVPVGGTWVEMDGNLPSGESFIRQFLYGQRFFKSEFGKICKEFWLPDTFGYSPQLPQIMRLCGVTRFLTQKLSWSLVNKFPHHTFWWEGIDGSRVLSHFPPGDSYEMEGRVKEVLFSLSNYRDKGRSGHSVYLFGYGDGGNGPSEDMLQRLDRIQNTDGLPKVKMSRPDDYFTQVEKNDADKLCCWKGELYLELHNGTYTTQAKVKQMNRKCEFLLRDVEFVSCMAMFASPEFSYPSTELQRLWKLLLLNQFHDVIPGSSIGLVYKDAHQYYKDIEQTSKDLWHKALCQLLGSCAESKDFAVFNTLGWERAEVITLPGGVDCGEEPVKKMIKPENDQVQLDSKGNSLGLVSVPAFGFARLQTLDCLCPVTVMKQGDLFYLENQYLKAGVDHAGRLVQLCVQGQDRNAIDSTYYGNQLVMFDDIPLFWDAWDVMDYHLETRKPVENVIQHCMITDSGPLRASLQFSLRISDNSYLKQTMSLDATSPYLKCDTEVTWHENRKFLKVEFPTTIKARQATYEIQFGHLQRSNHFNTSWDWAQFEVCGHKWADLSEYGFGLAILNDSKYGFSCLDNVLRMSLLRSPKAPDAKADMGTHTFTYAIMPHAGNYQDAGVIQQSYNLNCPLQVQSKVNNDVSQMSYFQLNTSQVILETVKKHEDKNCLVLRLYEAFGGHTNVSLSTPLNFTNVYRCSGLEEMCEEDETMGPLSVNGHEISFAVKPFQIISLVLEM